ncbi:hypothetical protein F1189_23620 [Rhodovastum atsumiense]|uniref:Uncharacterized protein n=1 Tax=Rhodovastum atsumiense TaxID=504468 RepID=A0A5M6IPW5_9PROT|nr:hypothetical protein F1189_23620 [Rhodovastum atsumiense]
MNNTEKSSVNTEFGQMAELSELELDMVSAGNGGHEGHGGYHGGHHGGHHHGGHHGGHWPWWGWRRWDHH